MLILRLILVLGVLVGVVSLALFLISGNRAYLQVLARGFYFVLLVGVVMGVLMVLGHFFRVVM